MIKMRELLKRMQNLRKGLDDQIIAERIPDGFVSRIAALVCVNGLDAMIEDAKALIDVAQQAEDDADQANTQHDAQPSAF